MTPLLHQAAQVNLRPLVGVFDGQFIRHTDITLRLCGNMHYMQHFSDNAHEVSYVEGTVDQREVQPQGVSYLLALPCLLWCMSDTGEGCRSDDVQ